MSLFDFIYNLCCIGSITVKVIDINSKEHKVQISMITSVHQLKQIISEKYCKSLSLKEMALYYQNQEISDEKTLGDLNIDPQLKKNLVFYQRKVNLSKVSKLNVHFEEDKIECTETYVAQMPCGHSISRDTMVLLVRSEIDQGNFQVRCLNVDEEEGKCSATWDFRLCKKVGVLTKEQMEEFENGLNMNWFKRFGKKCPNLNCQLAICKGDLQTNKVICPSCKSHQFCYICLEPWKSNSQTFCGSQICKNYLDTLSNPLLTRIFQVNDRASGKKITVTTPRYRMCPHCRMLVENYIYCKHTKCTNCKKDFCWICLAILEDEWPCGGGYDFCGQIAPIQNLI